MRLSEMVDSSGSDLLREVGRCVCVCLSVCLSVCLCVCVTLLSPMVYAFLDRVRTI